MKKKNGHDRKTLTAWNTLFLTLVSFVNATTVTLKFPSFPLHDTGGTNGRRI